MPKINNNPIMKGVSGMLGGVVVYRQFRGMTIMSNRPGKAKVMTPHQQATKSRFLLAVEYAKRQMADPELKATYKPGPGSEFASAYIAAVTDYLRRAKQNENRLENNKIANDQDSLEPAVCVNAEIDKSSSLSTVILSGIRGDKCSLVAAKDLLQVSRVCFRRGESVRTLLQRDPSSARAGPRPPLRMTFYSVVCKSSS